MNRILAFTPHILAGLGGYFFPFTTGVVLSAFETANQWKRLGRALLRVTITGLVLFWVVEGANLGWDTRILELMVRWDWIVAALLTILVGLVVYRREMSTNDSLFAPFIFGFNTCSDFMLLLLVCAGCQAVSGREMSPLLAFALAFIPLFISFLWYFCRRWDRAATVPGKALNLALHLEADRGLCFTSVGWYTNAMANIHVPPEQRAFLRWLNRFNGGDFGGPVGGAYREEALAEQPPVELDPEGDPIHFWRRVYAFASGMEKPDQTAAGWFAQGGFIPVVCGVSPTAWLYEPQWQKFYQAQIVQLVDDLAYRHRVEAAYGPVGPDETVAGPGETSASDEGLLGYQGKRLPDGSVVVEAVRPNQPPRRLHPANSRKIWIHSDHFDWGYAGHAPAQLALAIALDYSQDREQALLMYPALLFALIRGLPLDQWFIPVEDPLKPKRRAADGPPPDLYKPKYAKSLAGIWTACEESRLVEVPATAAGLPGDPEKDLFALRPPTSE